MSRVDALTRLWAFVWVNTAGLVLVSLVSVLAFVWGPLDILLTLATGNDYLSADSTPGRWVSETVRWWARQTAYAFAGDGAFAWRPTP